MPRRMTPRLLVAGALVVGLAAARLTAHEIPNDVTIQAYVKPGAQTLQLLVRVPLISLRDMTWPFRQPDILDLAHADTELTNAATLWLRDEATVFENDQPLPTARVVHVRATLPTDRAFENLDSALALLNGPPPPVTDEISVKEGFLDVLFEYPIRSSASRFSFTSRWGRLGIRALTILHFALPDGSLRTFQAEGNPGLVRFDPTWGQSLRRFAGAGLSHVLDNVDLLLFLAALALPLATPGRLLIATAAFGVAQFATLVGAALALFPDALWFPTAIQTLAAVSILYMAIENVVAPASARRPMTAFSFGLVHGFGVSLALRPILQYAGSHLVTSVLSFDVGVLLCEVVVVIAVAVLAQALFRLAIPARAGVVVLSALIAHVGWHAMLERWALLVQYQFSWPEMTPAFLASALRWAMLAVASAGALWLIGVLTQSQVHKSQVHKP